MADNKDSADTHDTATTQSPRRWGQATALVAGGLVAGGILASTVTALAAPDDTTTTDTSTTDSSTTTDDDAGRDGPHSDGGGHAGEEPLTGDIASQVETAALAEYPDATVVRLETDSDGVYEAHLETADGTRVTVEVDEGFAVTGEETHG